MGRRRKHVVAGKIWAVDRRTTRRYFLLSPDGERRIENAFWYCLGVCANKYGIAVHAAVLMSTHPHLVYTDTRGQQPLFKRDFHRLLACSIKAIRAWPEEVFRANSAGGEHEPLNERALVEAIGYLIANPVSAFAVRYAQDWPGAKTLPHDIGTRVVCARRPDVFFDPGNPEWPEQVQIRLVMPERLEDAYGGQEARRRIADVVRRHEREALSESRRAGMVFKGARRVLRTPHTARAHSYEIFGKINPRFSAAGDMQAAAAKVRELREFDAQYDEALALWMTGRRQAVFPHGTWWMLVHHRVRVGPPPRPPP